ncbi:MAG TPA: ATP-binding protein [Rhodospirillales bacterium]|nr:ATP-binding protein [Rhodospirillales bacterium]
MSTSAALALGALGVAVLAGLVVLWLWQRLGAAQRRQRDLEREVEAGREMLAAAPDGLLSWDRVGGGEYCSRRLAVSLNLANGTASRFADVLSCFHGDDSDTLERAVAALRDVGHSFDLVLPVAGGPRSVRTLGVRAAAVDGRPLADLLWVRDVAETLAPAATGNPHATPASEDARTQELLDALPIPIWLRDAECELVFANRASAGVVVAASTRELAARARAENKGLAERRRERTDGADGTNGMARTMEISEVPIPGWSGSIGFAMELPAEPAGRGPAETEVLEGLATAVAIFGPDARLKSFNPAYAELWQLDGGWLSSEPGLGEILERLRGARRLPEFADFRAFKEKQQAQFSQLKEPVEELMHLPDGTTLRVVVGLHAGGGLFFSYEDVSDRLALERSYNTLIAVQQETLDHLHEGVAVFGSDGRLKLSNPEFRRLWSLSDDEVAEALHVSGFVEKMKPLIIGEDNWDGYKERVVAGLVSREPRSGRLVRGDGRVVEYANVPLPDGASLVSYLDVTDSVRVEMALRERAEALQEADRLKSEFIANVSYEIRTPLNTIIGFAHLLNEEYFGKLNRRQLEYSGGIMETSEGLMSVIGDILDLATIEAGMMAVEVETVELHSMLVGVLSLVRERVRRKNLNLEFDCAPDIGWIVVDERRLKQVMFNLLSNAVAFTPAGGKVTLAAVRDSEEVAIAVSDSGPGIPKAEQARVFRAFEQGVTPDADQSGAGLGLSLVKSFVELHGGRVALRSLPNRGTTVTCTLPTAPHSAPDASPHLKDGSGDSL